MFTIICAIFFLVLTVYLIRGYLKPEKSAYWSKYKDAAERRRGLIGYLFGVVVLMSVVYFVGRGNKPAAMEAKSTRIGEVFHSASFDIMVNKFNVSDSIHINVGNKYIDEKAPPGKVYLVINSTFTNQGNKVAIVGLGSLKTEDDKDDDLSLTPSHFWHNGLNNYEVDPLASKTVDLVFEIPKELKTGIYWLPPGSDKENVIYLGETGKERHAHVHAPEPE